MKGFRGIAVVFAFLPAVTIASPFGPREMAKPVCVSLASRLGKGLSGGLKAVSEFFLQTGMLTPTEVADKMLAANSSLQGTTEFYDRVQKVIQRLAKLEIEFDFVGMARNYPERAGNAGFLVMLEGATALFAHIFDYDQVLERNFATKMIHDHNVEEYRDLLELQFLFHQSQFSFGFLKNGSVTRFGGGPSTIDSNNHPIFKVSPKVLADIPVFLLPAAILWHWELLRVMSAGDFEATNQWKIGNWILHEAQTSSNDGDEFVPGAVFSVANSKVGRLKPDLRDALIENTLLRRLVRLYRKARDIDELDSFRTRTFDELSMGSESHSDTQIGEMIQGDYRISPRLLDLTSSFADLDLIVESCGAVSGDLIRSAQMKRVRAQGTSPSLWKRFLSFLPNLGSEKSDIDMRQF